MILITGANGQLGRAFVKLFSELNIKYEATGVNELDITDLVAIRAFVTKREISVIINCAAYTNVDKSETEWKLAYNINTLAVKNLAIVANEINCILVHYSTDYVFDGGKKKPYHIFDIPNPLSVYGKSKLFSEEYVTHYCNEFIIIRTSWVFGNGPVNFIKKVISWAENKKEVNIVDDEISAPTFASDLAKFSYELIKQRKFGLFHITNSGECSRYEWAKFILNEIGWEGKVNNVKKALFQLPAKRPDYSKLDSFGCDEFTIPDWKNATHRYIQEYILMH